MRPFLIACALWVAIMVVVMLGGCATAPQAGTPAPKHGWEQWCEPCVRKIGFPIFSLRFLVQPLARREAPL